MATTPNRYVSRAEWGATSRGATPSSHPIGSTYGVTLHWEGPRMGSFDHSQCDNYVRGIQDFHKNTRGWADIAYNAVVCPHGYVFEGRGPGVTSAANGNATTNGAWYAVCYLGGVGDPFTDEGKQGMVEAVRWLRREGAGPKVNGHRDHKATECPGDAIYAWLKSANFDEPILPPMPPPTPAEQVRAGLRKDVGRLLTMVKMTDALAKRMRVRAKKVDRPEYREIAAKADAVESATRELRQALVTARANLKEK